MFPMVDLKLQYQNLKPEFDATIADVLNNTQFMQGPNVQKFEHEDKSGNHVYHQYTKLSPKRNLIMKALPDKKIAGAIYYPMPLHQQNVFIDDYRDIPLPIAPEISTEQILLITSTIRTVF